MRLQREETILVVIDVQEKLMPVIDAADTVVANLDRLIRGFHVLGVPLLVTEQYVKGLGPTVATLRRTLEETAGYDPIEKSCFSAARCSTFMERIRATERRHVVVAGVETHVCVHQTIGDLLEAGFDVTIIADAVSSRSASNREIALRRIVSEGARLSSTEMVLFELLGASGTDDFRAISKLVR
jgi:nicotinamidase-related amidase